jgi:hypothetical protein
MKLMKQHQFISCHGPEDQESLVVPKAHESQWQPLQTRAGLHDTAWNYRLARSQNSDSS